MTQLTATSANPFSKTSFLVVDDFEVMQKLTGNLLKQLGVEKITFAKNGLDALKILKSQKIDFVLSDWNMPVMDGLELLKAIRADNDLGSLPVVMITAEAERQRVEAAIANGVSGMLLKPYASDALRVRIVKAMSAKPRKAAPIPSNEAVPPAGVATNAQAGAALGQPKAKPRPTIDRATILVVDDTPDNLSLMSGVLRDEFRVQLANSGEKALEVCFSATPPDLILLDVMMLEMDGFEVARRLREHPNTESIPVVFVTAMSSADARIKGLGLGAVDYVVKPIDPDILLPRVRNFIRYVQMRKTLQLDYDEMVEAAHLRDDVDQITRHDLKGPLAGILGVVQNLINTGPQTPDHVEQLKLVEQTALQVLNMINLSAELYKIESGRFQLVASEVDLESILLKISDINRVAFSSSNLEILVTHQDPTALKLPAAMGDAMLCYSLFQNLLKNACEAAPQGSVIEVKLLQGDFIGAAITNKGAVPAEIRSRFFDKYVTSGKKGGTGLGTYSAKLLCQAQNGQIELSVDDDLDSTCITVKLPRQGLTPPLSPA